MNPLHAHKRPNNLEASEQQTAQLFRSGCACPTGVVLAYPDRCYADDNGLTFLNQLRQHLPNADDHQALPAQIMKCCTEVRNRDVLDAVAGLALTRTFDLGTHHIRLRVLSLPTKKPSHPPRVLVLLDSIANDAPYLGRASSQADSAC